MRFTSNTLGVLVRPRVLTHCFLESRFQQAQTTKTSWKALSRAVQAEELTARFDKFLVELFEDLSLGDTTTTTTSSQECYVGVVSSYITYSTYPRGSMFSLLHSEEQVKDMEQWSREKYGHSSIHVFAVGLKFYRNFNKETNTPSVPWEYSEQETWFYSPWDLVPMSNIVAYEKCEPGDLILTPKTVNIVLANKRLNKPGFYKTGSWTSHRVTMLRGSNGLSMFLVPDRKFEVVTPNDCANRLSSINS